MPTDEAIALAKQEVEGLKALLDDPHPGLSSWVELVGIRAGKVAWIFGYNPNLADKPILNR